MTHTPADRDADAKTVTPPHRYDYDEPGAVEAIRPTIDALARICDRVATKKAQRAEPAAEDAA